MYRHYLAPRSDRNVSAMENRHYLKSRADRNLRAMEGPIGDPFGGPAYGERLDVGGIVGGIVGGLAGDKASSQQAAGVQQANQLSDQQFRQIQANNRPFLSAGTAASNQLAALLGLDVPAYTRDQVADMLQSQGYGYSYGKSGKRYFVDSELQQAVDAYMTQQQKQLDAINAAKSSGIYGSLMKKFGQDDLNNDVVYNTGLQFGLDQGTNALNRQAAATGSLLSGATMKALTRYANDYGSTKANDAYNRFVNDQTNSYNKLAGVSGAGQQAVNTVAAAGQNYANNVGNNLIGLGNARGASSIAQGNAFGDALGGIANYGYKELFGAK